MHTVLINGVPQILNLDHAKSELPQIGTQLVLSRGLKDLSNIVEVLFPTLTKEQDVI